MIYPQRAGSVISLGRASAGGRTGLCGREIPVLLQPLTLGSQE